METLDLLQMLVGHPLWYAIKSPDMDLYDFGFGKPKAPGNTVSEYVVHAVCHVHLIWNDETRPREIFTGDTPAQEFHTAIQPLIGKTVRQVKIKRLHSLRLFFDDCRIVFATNEDDEESWRLFACEKDWPHMVASYYFLSFPDDKPDPHPEEIGDCWYCRELDWTYRTCTRSHPFAWDGAHFKVSVCFSEVHTFNLYADQPDAPDAPVLLHGTWEYRDGVYAVKIREDNLTNGKIKELTLVPADPE